MALADAKPAGQSAPYPTRRFSVRIRELLLEASSSPVGASVGIGEALAGLAAIIGVLVDLAVALGLTAAAIIAFLSTAIYRLEREVRNAADRGALHSVIDGANAGLITWAVEAAMGQLIAQEVDGEQTIVECGSGVTTLIIADQLRARAAGRLYSLEHDPAFTQTTEAHLDAARLAGWVGVITAPLAKQTFSGRRGQWPAIEALHERLTPAAVVLVDDGRRRARAPDSVSLVGRPSGPDPALA